MLSLSLLFLLLIITIIIIYTLLDDIVCWCMLTTLGCWHHVVGFRFFQSYHRQLVYCTAAWPFTPSAGPLSMELVRVSTWAARSMSKWISLVMAGQWWDFGFRLHCSTVLWILHVGWMNLDLPWCHHDVRGLLSKQGGPELQQLHCHARCARPTWESIPLGIT